MLWVSALLAVLGLAAGPASAIILYPQFDPPPIETPPDEATGRWLTSASFVVIGPNHIVTTRHQGGNDPVLVFIGGRVYQARTVGGGIGGPRGDADVRVLRLTTLDGEPANLPFYTPIYTRHDEIGQLFILGGFGKVRGTIHPSPGYDCGYYWAEGDGHLHWGANRIDSSTTMTVSPPVGPPFTSAVLVCDFDPASSPGAVVGEAASASGDSGGGWYLRDGETWRLIGLIAYADVVDYTDYQPVPTRNYAIRVSELAAWINGLLGYRPVSGDRDRDGDVDYDDYVQLRDNYNRPADAWENGDYNGDQQSNYLDYIQLKRNYGYQFLPGPAPVVPPASGPAVLPEPASVLLLTGGAMLLLRRRGARPRLR